MRTTTIFLLSIIGTLFFFSRASAENVVTVTDANFEETVNNNQFVLMEFYAPWCGHCKNLAPEYEKAATQLANEQKADSPKVILAKLDATAETKSAEAHGISGFPTLKWFVNGKPTEYSGGRTADAIVTWIKKKTGPATTKLATVADIESFKESGEVVVILATGEESKTFENVAQAEEIPFGVVTSTSEDVLKALQLQKAGSIVVFKKFDEGRAEMPFTAETTAEAIGTFVSKHLLPLIVPFSQETAQKIFGGNVRQHVILFVDETNQDQLAAAKKEAQPVAEENRGKYLFVSVDKSNERVLEFFGVNPAKDIPTVRVVQLLEGGMKKYKMTGDSVTTAVLRDTLAKHTAGELPADLKSEEIPEKNDGDVKVIVGKNFDAIVKEPGKDVFVEFYAPWCGHCKALAPKWEELAKWAKNKPNLVIAKMDSTANEVDEVQISGFPTLKLFKADTNEIVDYDDARETENMIAFLEKNAQSCAASP